MRDFAANGNSSGGAEIRSELNKLLGELNQRVTQEVIDLMRSVS